MRRNETPYPICIKFCTVVSIPEVSHTNFGYDRLRGFWVVVGVKFPIPHRLSLLPLQHSRTTVRVCNCNALYNIPPDNTIPDNTYS